MLKLSKFCFFFLLFSSYLALHPANVFAQTLNCKFSSLASDTCQIQFGLSCDPGKHMERDCPLDCSYEGPIQCVSDSIPTAPPTPQPMDCFNAGGSCQPNDPSLCNGDLTVSAQCNPQKDSTGSSYRCCKPPVSEPPSSSGSSAFPELRFPCEKIKEPEDFHSLRPYQAAHCGDANKAIYCSNDLKFLETFDVKGKGDCVARHETGTFLCDPQNGGNVMGPVPQHDLIVTLDDSMFPIMGNTEEVKNHDPNSSDIFDDATKVNEYASWYLSGVNNRAEYGVPTNDQIVNFSGPLQKLLPGAIQDNQRITSILNASQTTTYEDDETTAQVTERLNHNQVVVCGKKEFQLLPSWFTNIFGVGAVGLGKTIPTPCYGDSVYRLSDWEGSSVIQDVINWATQNLSKLYSGNIVAQILTSIPDRWSKKTPPLPWNDGTGKPFVSSNAYLKAYKEWQGDLCIMIPLPFTTTSSFIGGSGFPFCIGIPHVTNNEYADLFPYIPLSNTTDKKGNNFIVDVQPAPAGGTQIVDGSFDYGEVRNAPLYFAHTQEVKESVELLNKTFTPLDCPVDENGKRIEGEECKLLKNKRGYSTTEKNYCSVVNIRVNKGDNLFPGDPDELQVPDVTYIINQAKCKETYEWVCKTAGRGTPFPHEECGFVSKLECTAQVYITIKTKTKTPNANEIFDETVAGTGSTFRKIFPKVGEGAPVSCIADMPTVTNVTYDPSLSQPPPGGDLEYVGTIRYPEDGAGDSPQLTFPHIGSIYEYFLKGIQTALRPKGYGEPITSGTLCNNIKCGELPELPKASGACSISHISSAIGNIPQTLEDIVEAAALTYKVPPNLILAQMYGEGLFNPSRYDWTDENVKNWATCEPIPNCNDDDGDDGFMGFYSDDWYRSDSGIAAKIHPDLLKLDPERKGIPSRCNLLDAVYGAAYNLYDSADGGGGMPPKCFGINLAGSIPTSCDWKEKEQYASAIQAAENGYDTECFTQENSCLMGGGKGAACSTGGDTCETITNRYTNPSHFACFWDVAHGQ